MRPAQRTDYPARANPPAQLAFLQDYLVRQQEVKDLAVLLAQLASFFEASQEDTRMMALMREALHNTFLAVL